MSSDFPQSCELVVLSVPRYCDIATFVFQQILTNLPELIHQRWQYHSIGLLTLESEY